MEKVLFNTKEEYIHYCKDNEVCNFRYKYGSTYTNIEDSIDRDTYIDDKNFISQEPKTYPCILVYGEFDDSFFGYFVYPNDFK